MLLLLLYVRVRLGAAHVVKVEDEQHRKHVERHRERVQPRREGEHGCRRGHDRDENVLAHSLDPLHGCAPPHAAAHELRMV